MNYLCFDFFPLHYVAFAFSIAASLAFSKTSDELNERIYPEDRTYLWSTIAVALKERKSYRIDHRIIRKDGVKCWVQESGMALYDEQGKPYHMMGTVMDITDRIESETDQKFLSQFFIII